MGAINRRQFIQLSAEASGGLLVAFALHSHVQAGPFIPNAWIRLDPTGEVTLLWSKSEMGQGVSTALPMILAEELDVDWRRVRTERAPTRDPYQTETGGSSSITSSWEDLRKAGAAVRGILIAAAASQWNVPPTQCTTEMGEVIHSTTGRRAPYGTLIERAVALPPPDLTKVTPKPPQAFRVIGTAVHRKDAIEKINGRAVFGIDVQVPSMLIASVARCPTYEGRVSHVDDRRARAVPGVRHVIPLEPVPTHLSGRVAVVADSWWAANRGRQALQVKWEHGPTAAFSTESMWRTARKMVNEDGRALHVSGQDDSTSVPRDARIVEAVYEVPFAAHACMEPMNCTADVRSDRAEIWAPTQAPQWARKTVAEATGLPEDNITVHVTYLGGGFGRRYYPDFVLEAAEISRRVGRPVKVIWTREDDIQHDLYRPAVLERFRAALDAAGQPLRWHNRVVAPSWERWWNTSTDHPQTNNSGDPPPYNITNVLIDYVELPRAVPIGAWRSVKHSQNGFCLESFIDECAIAAGRDPLDYRLSLLEGKPRQQAVLRLAAARASWGGALPRNRGRGVAFWNYAGTYVAQVIEVSVDSQRVNVDRVICAFDCGTIVNPDIVRAQIESAIGWGVSAALWGEITVLDGRTRQSNFHDYRVMRMNECPRIEIELVRNLEAPSGVGEAAVPPVAAAIANAVFAATGVRRRRLPLNA